MSFCALVDGGEAAQAASSAHRASASRVNVRHCALQGRVLLQVERQVGQRRARLGDLVDPVGAVDDVARRTIRLRSPCVRKPRWAAPRRACPGRRTAAAAPGVGGGGGGGGRALACLFLRGGDCPKVASNGSPLGAALARRRGVRGRARAARGRSLAALEPRARDAGCGRRRAIVLASDQARRHERAARERNRETATQRFATSCAIRPPQVQGEAHARLQRWLVDALALERSTPRARPRAPARAPR